jgi:hypothetical protein
MKPLTQRQADRCEQAREDICVCRCGGSLHGASRGSGSAFRDALPETDPHHVPSEQRKSEIRAEQKRKHAEAMARRYAARASFSVGVFDL